jgi:4-carboxymuconolactone decarboxylase
MDDSRRRAEGEHVRRRVLGNTHVDRAASNTSEMTADFQDLLTRYAWGEIWTRPGLDERSRRILVLGTLIALGRWDELRMHARAALTEGGFSVAELTEIVLQQAVYCGIPAANAAFDALREVLPPRA